MKADDTYHAAVAGFEAAHASHQQRQSEGVGAEAEGSQSTLSSLISPVFFMQGVRQAFSSACTGCLAAKLPPVHLNEVAARKVHAGARTVLAAQRLHTEMPPPQGVAADRIQAAQGSLSLLALLLSMVPGGGRHKVSGLAEDCKFLLNAKMLFQQVVHVTAQGAKADRI